MSVIKYKYYKIIIFAICIIVPLIFYIGNSINEQETITNIRRLQAAGLNIPPNHTPPEPQPKVECTGVHALCIFAECDPDGLCNCKIVDSLYQIATGAIKNDSIRAATLADCTYKQPCGVDEAPICEAIQNDEYYVNDELSVITSTYSWDSFCERAWPAALWTECNEGLWASCMMAPCNPNPAEYDFALCQCDVKDVPWIDNDPYQKCYYPPNIIKATVPTGFDFGFFSGTEYVFQACEQQPKYYAPPTPWGQPVPWQRNRARYDGRNYRSTLTGYRYR